MERGAGVKNGGTPIPAPKADAPTEPPGCDRLRAIDAEYGAAQG